MGSEEMWRHWLCNKGCAVHIEVSDNLNYIKAIFSCSKQEDVQGEGRLKALAEQKKVLQSPAEPEEGSRGQDSEKKGAETANPTKEQH